MNRLKRLISEIHRRSLWQVLLIYIGAAWACFELIDAVTNRLGLPPWLPGLAIVLFLLGLPFVVATAFVREVTPPAVAPPEAEAEEPAEALAARHEARRRHRFVTWRSAGLAFLSAFALWGVVAAGWLVLGGGEAGVERKSVAVLPLDNLSGDEGTEPFVNGIHDDILTHLYKIADLKVISRTSVMEYRDARRNLRQIAEELGVATVLEGGVQRAGGRVRINVQLIDATTDEHLWAENYDRELTTENIFAVQTDIAQRIAAALRAELTPEESERIAARPTENLEAYEYYLRGRAERERSPWAGEAISYLEQAVELDPDFAAAWAELAMARIAVAWNRGGDTELRESGIEALDRAIGLAPEAFETLVAKAEHDRRVTQDLDRALEHLRVAKSLRPNDAYLYREIGITQRYAGRWDEALASFEKAAELDPLNALVAERLADTHVYLGRFEIAERYFDRAIALDPSRVLPTFWFLLYALGDTTRALESADQHPDIPERWLAELHYVRRDYQKALEIYLSRPINVEGLQKIYYLTNEPQRLIALTDSITPSSEARLNRAIEAQAPPGSISGLHRRLGQDYAYLGDREAALREAEKAIEVYPVSSDALNYSTMRYTVARIYILTGDYEQAIDQLEIMLSGPTWFRAAWLRLDPFYDPLRDHPRFQALLEEYGQ